MKWMLLLTALTRKSAGYSVLFDLQNGLGVHGSSNGIWMVIAAVASAVSVIAVPRIGTAFWFT